MRSSRTTALAVAGVLSIGLLASCSSDDADGTGEGGKVKITVAGLLPTADDAAKEQLAERVAAFEEEHPDIDVETEDYEWKASTFTTQLAGGTLPNVFEIPLTDGKTLIENGQLADIDAQVRALPYGDDFNEALLANGTGDDGKVYAVPAKSIYAVALHYNRNLFEQAGLDPDQPPTTWDEVREYAKQIHDATGVAGYATMALDNAGGWQLAAGANSRGGVIETFDGEQYTATLDDPAVAEHLQWLHDLKWEDGSLLDRTDLGWGDINTEFAAGNLAMYTSGSDVYNSLVEANGVTADWGYGLTAIPTSGDGGALTGGTMAAVTKQSTDEQKDAAVKWIDWWYLSKLQDQDQAVADARTRAEADPAQAVGTPVLPIFSKENYEQSLEWVADYVNVPLEDMTGYTDVMFDQELVPEASAAVQDLYAQLFPVVQAVISDEDADVDALLATANEAAQQAIDG
ncbi:ABC transporter substrate-binding protein [Cellulomonas fimi]|uniref:Extracellular solute-binding protein family 1 n=1 Tax=Cellulomonas fimi (strain ATCC 484 / DSM 20113 / JCM 1341 / CCUG 24087 / LMG 16345 / NBRC 15513 / NCIMB 8980 / NCTC 7547 / NRS-133) TaxID=590998 RepID=F4H460_CELFA|nr:extracellular solute-binding protein [Cellulomonas fimi]AEE45412.1 extracellular solute-binding protein family 1 [Cellulomonas fimi ATCC 484]NNH06835.1 extracellular solute-binding protein [Cellulomonas fimi]VEH29308.1 glycerol-3-phosphate transporter periplasmic binding protein [Cellulomonas fimi]